MHTGRQIMRDAERVSKPGQGGEARGFLEEREDLWLAYEGGVATASASMSAGLGLLLFPPDRVRKSIPQEMEGIVDRKMAEIQVPDEGKSR